MKQTGGKDLSDFFDIYTGDGGTSNKISNWTITIDEEGNVEI